MNSTNHFFDIENHGQDCEAVVVHMSMHDRIIFPQIDKILLKLLDRVDLRFGRTYHRNPQETTKLDLDIKVADDVFGEETVLVDHLVEPAAQLVGVESYLRIGGYQYYPLDIYDHEGDRYPVTVAIALADYDWNGQRAALDKCNYVRQVCFRVSPRKE